MPVSRRRKAVVKHRQEQPRTPPASREPITNAGPYAEKREATSIFGRSLEEMEALPLFVMGEFKLRKMVEKDRLYTNGESWLLVTVDGERQVTQVVLSLLPPEEDHPDERFRINARGKDGQPLRLTYQWALLVHFAHGVLGLGPRDSSEFLTQLWRPEFLPILRGGLKIDLLTGHFHGGPENMAVGARRAETEDYSGAVR